MNCAASVFLIEIKTRIKHSPLRHHWTVHGTMTSWLHTEFQLRGCPRKGCKRQFNLNRKKTVITKAALRAPCAGYFSCSTLETLDLNIQYVVGLIFLEVGM